jgi:hypothetical protein
LDENQERTATRTVCETVPRTRGFTVNVVHYRPVERTGTRTRVVHETVNETVSVPETYCVMVPYTQTVKVPAMTCAYEERCGGRHGRLRRHRGCY